MLLELLKGFALVQNLRFLEELDQMRSQLDLLLDGIVHAQIGGRFLALGVPGTRWTLTPRKWGRSSLVLRISASDIFSFSRNSSICSFRGNRAVTMTMRLPRTVLAMCAAPRAVE